MLEEKEAAMIAHYPFPQTYQTPQQHTSTQVARVTGESGARAYSLAPNSSVLLMDETAPIVWLKTTDSAGYPSLQPYSISPYNPEEPVNLKDLEHRIARLEEMFNDAEEPERRYVATESRSA